MTKMRQWSILTVVAVIIVFAAGWFLLVKPQKSKSTQLRSDASSEQQQNERLQAQIASLKDEEKALPQQQAALRKFTTQVPDNAAEPTIIRQLSDAAAGSGVNLVSLTPGTAAAVVPAASTTGTTGTTDTGTTTSLTPSTTSAGTLMQLPISIGITGTFPNVESFFQSLETLPRALLVSGWSLCLANPPQGGASAASSGSSGTSASCTPPTLPQDKEPPSSENAIGGTLSATIFYAPPAGTAVPGSTTTAPTTTTTTPPTTTTPAPTTAATPPTTGATTPPAS